MSVRCIYRRFSDGRKKRVAPSFAETSSSLINTNRSTLVDHIYIYGGGLRVVCVCVLACLLNLNAKPNEQSWLSAPCLDFCDVIVFNSWFRYVCVCVCTFSLNEFYLSTRRYVSIWSELENRYVCLGLRRSGSVHSTAQRDVQNCLIKELEELFVILRSKFHIYKEVLFFILNLEVFPQLLVFFPSPNGNFNCLMWCAPTSEKWEKNFKIKR